MVKPAEWLSGCEGWTYWFIQQCAMCCVLGTRDRDHHHTPVPALRGSRCCADVRKAITYHFVCLLLCYRPREGAGAREGRVLTDRDPVRRTLPFPTVGPCQGTVPSLYVL